MWSELRRGSLLWAKCTMFIRMYLLITNCRQHLKPAIDMSKPFSQKSFPLTWCVISPWSVGHCMSQTHAMCLKSGLWLCCRCFKVNMSKGFFDTFSIALRKCCQISRRCRWGLSSLYNMHLLLHEGIDFFPAFKPVSRSSPKTLICQWILCCSTAASQYNALIPAIHPWCQTLAESGVLLSERSSLCSLLQLELFSYCHTLANSSKTVCISIWFLDNTFLQKMYINPWEEVVLNLFNFLVVWDRQHNLAYIEVLKPWLGIITSAMVKGKARKNWITYSQVDKRITKVWFGGQEEHQSRVIVNKWKLGCHL